MINIGLFTILIGLIAVMFGIIIIAKQLVWAASSHSNVKDKDAKPFTKMVGTATVGFGVSIICFGIGSEISMITLCGVISGILFIASLVLYFVAQQKYNK